jgi:hypothetical protein
MKLNCKLNRHGTPIQRFGWTLLALAGVGFSNVGWPQSQGDGRPQDNRNRMSFFVTSTGMGSGGNLGGLAGADAHCQRLADSVGAGDRKWQAYLSTFGEKRVEARDRIGVGPWYNAEGVMIARNLTDLHVANNISRETALTEKGEIVPGRDDEKAGRGQARHDVLTGTQPDGSAYTDEDYTCKNWTSDSPEIKTRYGHHDRQGGGQTSWNSAHFSRGCSEEDFRAWGARGFLYCFAVDAVPAPLPE